MKICMNNNHGEITHNEAQCPACQQIEVLRGQLTITTESERKYKACMEDFEAEVGRLRVGSIGKLEAAQPLTPTPPEA